MAAVLAKLTKLSPGPSVGIPEFNKAMSKLASYSHSPKYQKVFEELVKEGVIQLEESPQNVVVETQVAQAPIEALAETQVPGAGSDSIAPVVEDSITAVVEASVEDAVTAPAITETKSPVKKKR